MTKGLGLTHVMQSMTRLTVKSEKEWCVARFVRNTQGEMMPGWPFRWVCGALWWSDTKPVAFFTKEEAECEAAKLERSPISIAIDRAVHVSEFTWKVELHSFYDGSSEEYVTTDYREAAMAFAVAVSVEVGGNTERVKYLKASLVGECPVDRVELLGSGLRALATNEGPKQLSG